MTQETALAMAPPIELSTIEKVIVGGDLRQLSPEQRVSYYGETCRSLGLNPMTRPFEYLMLNGKLALYARKECAEQLRFKHRVSASIVERRTENEVHMVTVRTALPDGRTDESLGAVSIAGLKGEALANAYMKTETKAKRRATLSICGLGMLDESEIDSIPDARRVRVDFATHKILEEPAKPRALLPAEEQAPPTPRSNKQPVFDVLMREIEICPTQAAMGSVSSQVKTAYGMGQLTKEQVAELRARKEARLTELTPPVEAEAQP